MFLDVTIYQTNKKNILLARAYLVTVAYASSQLFIHVHLWKQWFNFLETFWTII